MRHATLHGAYHIDEMPGQPQIALCHGFFVAQHRRGQGHGHALKANQMAQLGIDHNDYAFCSVDSANVAQQRVLRLAGWSRLTDFANSKTGGRTELWGWAVAEGFGEAAPRTEALKWHNAETAKPDSDMTVLCWGSEGFFCGYWDDAIPGWIGCESGGSVMGVTHWANPNGPEVA